MSDRRFFWTVVLPRVLAMAAVMTAIEVFTVLMVSRLIGSVK
jgi:hypothetical protein